MAEIVLLRHAHVVQMPEVPTQQWNLSDDGRAAALRLGAHRFLADVKFFLSGDEPKMVETATACSRGQAVSTCPDLRELHRDVACWLSSEAEYRDLIRKILGHPNESIQGCESAASAQNRVVTAIDEVLKEEPDAKFAVVSGGLTLTLYLSYLQRKDVPDFALWKSIRFPDIAVVDPLKRRVVHSFGSATEF
jgi:broad specificity phosphatase PhoE